MPCVTYNTIKCFLLVLIVHVCSQTIFIAKLTMNYPIEGALLHIGHRLRLIPKPSLYLRFAISKQDMDIWKA